MEHETLGIYLSGHPLNDYADILASLPDTAAKLSGKSGEENVEIGPQEGDKVKIGGIITHVQRKLTRSGSGMHGVPVGVHKVFKPFEQRFKGDNFRQAERAR